MTEEETEYKCPECRQEYYKGVVDMYFFPKSARNEPLCLLCGSVLKLVVMND